MEDLKREKNASQQEDDVYYGVGSFLWEVVKVFFWALLIIVPIRVFLFQPFFVQGASMEPNFHDGDYLIVNEFGYKDTEISLAGTSLLAVHPFRDLERGDIVVFQYPRNPKQYFIKRIIGLPGETVMVKEGKVFVTPKEGGEAKMLDEQAYVDEKVNTAGNVSKVLAQDEYFVMGDNRPQSHDSRAWGPVTKDKIVGKVLLRAWPLGKARVY
ncbi:MAG TPA: signal peptidase I [Candidatus Moranbacteria bacterium]|nr:signal peptidase I [Candidatus Moranbacteria bacterium]